VLRGGEREHPPLAPQFLLYSDKEEEKLEPVKGNQTTQASPAKEKDAKLEGGYLGGQND